MVKCCRGRGRERELEREWSSDRGRYRCRERGRVPEVVNDEERVPVTVRKESQNGVCVLHEPTSHTPTSLDRFPHTHTHTHTHFHTHFQTDTDAPYILFLLLTHINQICMWLLISGCQRDSRHFKSVSLLPHGLAVCAHVLGVQYYTR